MLLGARALEAGLRGALSCLAEELLTRALSEEARGRRGEGAQPIMASGLRDEGENSRPTVSGEGGSKLPGAAPSRCTVERGGERSKPTEGEPTLSADEGGDGREGEEGERAGLGARGWASRQGKRRRLNGRPFNLFRAIEGSKETGLGSWSINGVGLRECEVPLEFGRSVTGRWNQGNEAGPADANASVGLLDKELREGIGSTELLAKGFGLAAGLDLLGIFIRVDVDAGGGAQRVGKGELLVLASLFSVGRDRLRKAALGKTSGSMELNNESRAKVGALSGK